MSELSYTLLASRHNTSKRIYNYYKGTVSTKIPTS